MHISLRFTPWAFLIHSIEREMDKSIVHVSSHFYNPRLKPWAMNRNTKQNRFYGLREI